MLLYIKNFHVFCVISDYRKKEIAQRDRLRSLYLLRSIGILRLQENQSFVICHCPKQDLTFSAVPLYTSMDKVLFPPLPGFYLLRSTVIVPLHENQNFIICDRNVSHNFLNSDSFFNAFYQRSANISFCNNCSFKQTDFKKKQWM